MFAPHQKAPPLAGELLSVSEAEGEQLAVLGNFKPFPFRLLVTLAATFPVNGDSFWLEFAPYQKVPSSRELAMSVSE